ncbi:MAG: hypothetical protein M1837_000893 [Sclerophora amabilis]|nr:MAG: hypothetical protein M1837_000893 [Sclerophora amabilis]
MANSYIRASYALRAARRLLVSPKPHPVARQLHGTAIQCTDGVYPALTEMRVKTPYIEALRHRRDEKGTSHSEKPPTDRDVSPKKMSQSFHRVVLPLAQDQWLLDSYLNATGDIRLGTLFMDLDALSGVIAYKHTGESVMTVTAAIDRITINHRLKEICDLELSGQVTFATGRSSMEISLQVAKAPAEGQEVKDEDVMMTCAFTMVSLDPSTKKAVPVSPLKVETAKEREIFELGEQNYKSKKALAQTTLRKQTPNDEESDLIHAMWLRQLDYHDPNLPIRKPDNLIYMDTTKVHSSQIMQPQYRNRHNFMIFGGFLLKQTFELAFCCCASFSHSRPTFVSLDPSTFENPVPVGSVLYMTATVAYTEPLLPPSGSSTDSSDTTSGARPNQTRVQVRVDSKVRNVEHGETKPTGQFNYTFLVDQDIKVTPRTYSEFMIWVDARRRAERVTASLRGVDKTLHGDNRDDGKGAGITE